MRKSDLLLVKNYLHRFFEGPLITRTKCAAIARYAALAASAVWDKLRGFDYAMVYYTKNENPHNSVYTMAPNKVLKRVFSDIDYSMDAGFIDVGCGKGYVVTQAFKQPFKRVGGVEYTQFLYDTCCRNLRKKGLSTEHIYHMDARNFEHFGDFNIFS